MPERGSFGPGGRWIYQRAARIRKKNPDMEESTSFAVATQQAHKVGKSPKKFRTKQGVREAKVKFSLPKKEYQKTAAKEASADIGSVDELLEKISARKHRPPKYKRTGRLGVSIGERTGDSGSKIKVFKEKAPKGAYEGPGKYTTRVLEKHQMDPGRVQMPEETSARQVARERGVKGKGGKVQPLTFRQRLRGAKQGGGGAPRPTPRPRPTPAQVSKLRKIGIPAAVIGGLGLAAGAGAYALHQRKKKMDAEIKEYFKKRASAIGKMLPSFVDEMAKISQVGSPASASSRFSASQDAASNVQNFASSGGAQGAAGLASSAENLGGKADVMDTKTDTKSSGPLPITGTAPNAAGGGSSVGGVGGKGLGSSALGLSGASQLGRGAAAPGAGEFGG